MPVTTAASGPARRARRLEVLMIDAGSRQSLPFIKALRLAGHRVVVACPSRVSMGFLCRYAERRLLWPAADSDRDGYVRAMLDYVRRRRPDVTLALEDDGAEIASLHKPELLRYTALALPDHDVFLRAADKARTMAFCMDHGLPCPRTFFPQRQGLEEIIAACPFPAIVKPRRGIGAVGVHRIDTPDELRRHWDKLCSRYGDLIVQEYIPLAGGTQFQAEAFLDADSRMKACLVIAKPRFFPITGGTSTANVTIDRPGIQQTARRLLEGIGWIGAADVDFILDPRDNVPKILEINPRVTAGIKIAFMAGIDFADLSMRLALGEPVPEIASYRLGVELRNLCLDILWYIFADKHMRRNTWPPYFRFFGRDVHYQTFSADDPLPLAGFILTRLAKFASKEKRREKLARDL